ncbi:hypothetical protein RBH94_13575 [Aestuariibaculum sp. YM273]|uniref:hypothetical protein n=1 Tax=Aestuariibaculum sp. YM273 TaxID=3070659 RepID=UPI0027DC45FC|nr:hypothetical protein [Aestuariibaculum sp. YM273]WMI65081.1 hypothetical protein RBH94_13575 [Aestuariibaculum sp. YM273]
MKTNGIFFKVMITFLLAFAAASLVTLLWNLLIEKNGAIVDWRTSFFLAILIGIVLPIARNKIK